MMAVLPTGLKSLALDLPVESGAFPVNPLFEVEGSNGETGGYQNNKPFCCWGTENLHLISLGSMIYQWKLAMVYIDIIQIPI